MGQAPCFGGTQAGPPNAAGIQAGAAGNNPRTISLRKLKKATKNFCIDGRVGEGGSAHVFRGTLRNGQIVAVKRLKPAEGRNASYNRELGVLSHLSHPNIIRLIGRCAHEDTERIIVYEFMPLRTLYDHLHARPAGVEALAWDMRMRIGAGLAKGLSYLHNEADPRVIYRDLKPRNVLLGEDYHPKISDFGIAISAPSNDRSSSVTVTDLMGTPPYWAPEGALSDRLSPKSDVYSFGVLLLEIIAGTVPMDARRPRYVADWVMREENFVGLADPEMNGLFPEEDLINAMKLARQCMKLRPASRPNMRDVVRGMNYLAGDTNAEWPEEFNTADDPADSSTRYQVPARLSF